MEDRGRIVDAMEGGVEDRGCSTFIVDDMSTVDVAGEGCAPQTTRLAGRRHKTRKKKRRVTLAWPPKKLRRQGTADRRSWEDMRCNGVPW